MVHIKLPIMLILIMQTQSESRIVNTKVKIRRVIPQKSETPAISDEPNRCDELSPVVLNDILGAAFNSRCVHVHDKQWRNVS